MVINIERIAEMKHTDECILCMPHGMLGFKDCKQYVLVESEQYAPFKCLLSVDNPQLAFMVIDPLDFFPEYDIELSDSDAEDLEVTDARDIKLITTVTIDRGDGWMTTNLMGPVIINTKTLVAKQIVLDDDRYGTKHLIGNKSYYESTLTQRQAV